MAMAIETVDLADSRMPARNAVKAFLVIASKGVACWVSSSWNVLGTLCELQHSQLCMSTNNLGSLQRFPV